MRLPSLLAAATLAAALLTTIALRLFKLSGAATIGFASHLAYLVVAILNHVLATRATCLSFILCHSKLLSPRPRPL